MSATSSIMDDKNLTPQEQDEEKKRNGLIAFVGSMTFSILVIIMFFAFGSIFLSQAEFYTRYKMTGRFPDKPPYTTEFPYKNYFTESDEDGFINRIMRWLTSILITAFSDNRFILDKFLEYTGDLLKEAPGFVSSLFLIFSPVILLGLLVVTYFAGMFSSVAGAISNIEMVIPTLLELTLMALPLGIPLLLYAVVLMAAVALTSFGIGIAQTLMMFGFMVVIPMMDANVRQGVVNTMIDNRYLMLMVIFSVMTFNAFGMLNKTYGYISLGMAVAALATYIFMKVL